MENQYEEATWTCPVCGYTLFGTDPAVYVICDNCIDKEGIDKEEYWEDLTPEDQQKIIKSELFKRKGESDAS